ncbi:MAG: hypothetical protein V1870_01185 [Candidatus Aenigmatarchaeota archaeon]
MLRTIERTVYERYFSLASELHLGGYDPAKMFNKDELLNDLHFAEDLFIKVKAVTGVVL